MITAVMNVIKKYKTVKNAFKILMNFKIINLLNLDLNLNHNMRYFVKFVKIIIYCKRIG